MPDTKATPERKTVTIDFTNEPAVYDWIANEAKADERSRAVWLRRMIVEQFDNADKGK